MKKIIPVTTLFLDIGGILLSNGWGHESHKSAADFFKLNYNEMQVRHKLTMVTYEEGQLTLNEYRINKLKLNRFVDFFISSCFVHFRKPDADIFRIAPDIAQVPAEHVVYIENTRMFVDVARHLEI